MTEQVYIGAAQYKLIYIFAIHDKDHEGYLKIGEHSFISESSYKQLPPNCDELNANAHSRIRQYTRTALTQYELLHTELARKQIRLQDGTIEATAFNDHDVHEVLDRSGFDVHKFYDTDRDSEWYKVDLKPAISAIRAVKEGRNILSHAEMETGDKSSAPTEHPSGQFLPNITLRDEQNACIAKTKKVFAKNNRMLWDCKMRFGKTVTAYSLVKEMDYQKVLVVTHRPAVVDGWSNDFRLIFHDKRVFVTKSDIIVSDRFTAEDASIDAENDRKLKNLAAEGRPFVYFASMQDLRGSKLADGIYEKNRAVFSMDWDIIIYDEAHEGTQTDLGQKVQTLLEKTKQGKTPKILQLSGTPYNLLSKYDDNNVYSWDYVMEQSRKHDWDDKHPGDHNPYSDLPEMKICTFDLRNKLSASYRYEDENIAFNFREFFRTWTGEPQRDFRPLPAGTKVGEFVHKEDVREFLNLISDENDSSNYPFSTKEYRAMFKHTFWILPGVKEARAFKSMLEQHPVFSAYKIVNVAGDGDMEEAYDDALRSVRAAIHNKENKPTITLSCGRLTTGVTVKEWTGVMLLSGSSVTAASGYMQTIFRVQSAGSIDGKQKKTCYAFDFAPDRALKVISDVHGLKQTSVRGDDQSRIRLKEFLNFCPILAEGENGMEYYDVPKLMRQLKRLTVDAAVKSGFDDDSIYKADAGIVMDKQKMRLFETLKGRLTPQKRGKQETTVTVNDQGLTDEQYELAQEAKHKQKKERTAEEKEALEKEKSMKKQQQALFDLLRNISIRLPLLIYGTAQDFNENIRLQDFIELVDDSSWKEFMPNEVDKDLFRKLLVFYDEDVISGAGMRIRRMAKAADEMMPTQRVLRIAEIFACFRNPAKETVLTPWRVVNMHMGDTIGGYNFYKEGYPEKDGLLDEPRLIEQDEVTSDIFLNENVRVLEMNSKSGLYPLYVAYSIYRMLLPKAEKEMTLEDAQAVWNEALRDHLFVLCQTKMAVSITKRTLTGYTGAPVNATFLTKLLERMQNPKRLANKLTDPKTWEKEGEKMKFDAIVGNPPYQGESGNTRKPSIYPLFYDIAFMLSDFVTLISPARFLSNVGDTSEEWNYKMLNDEHLKVVRYFPNSQDVFSTVEIKGGIVITIRDAKSNFGKIGTFIRSPELSGVLQKVLNQGEKSIMEFVSSRGIYRFTTEFFNDYPDAPSKLGKGTGNMMASNVFSCIPNAFYSEMPDDDAIRILGLEGKQRTWKWLKKKYLQENVYLSTYNVAISKVNGSGKFGETLTMPLLLNKNEGATDTFISIGLFAVPSEADNLRKYIMTKFARAMLGIKKVTQDNPKHFWEYVPIQDFSNDSEINWNKPIADIDKQLYEKYKLSPEELDFIESNVKPMLLSDIS